MNDVGCCTQRGWAPYAHQPGLPCITKRGLVFRVSELQVLWKLLGLSSLGEGILTATHPFRPIALSCVLTVDGWTETPMDVYRVEFDFLLALKAEGFKCC